MRTVDVAVVGGGVIGCAVAYTLACTTRLRIAVFERGALGGEASGAAAGVLAVASGRAPRGVLLELRRVGASMFPDLAGALEEETPERVGYERCGLLDVAFTEKDAEELLALVGRRHGQGFACEVLTGAALREAQPGLPDGIPLAVYFPDEATIDAAALVRALAAAARGRGVRFFPGTPVCAVEPGSSEVVLTLREGTVKAGRAVVAAGAWCGEVLARAGVRVPLRPARGEMLAVAGGAALRHTVKSGDTYLVARAGEIWVGSTNEFAGFDKRVTETGAVDLRRRAAALLPQLEKAVPLRQWAGLRPCPTIRRPIIAPVPVSDNIILATGHHRSGVLLAPITAKLVAEIIAGVAPSVPLHPFGYRRR